MHRYANSNKTMDIIEDETTDGDESDFDDHRLQDLLSPRINSVESSETGDENETSNS